MLSFLKIKIVKLGLLITKDFINVITLLFMKFIFISIFEKIVGYIGIEMLYLT